MSPPGPMRQHSTLRGGDRWQSPQLERVKVHLNGCKYGILRDVAHSIGFEVLDTEEEAYDCMEDWDLCWVDTSVTVERVNKLKSFQRLNHFPGMLEICRKVALAKNMARMARYLPEHYGFFPLTWAIPRQLDSFVAALRRQQKNSSRLPTYIIKPSNGSMGRGIHLVQTESDLVSNELTDSVAQTYIKNPLLIDGHKFDLRIYVLVRSVDPLEVHVYEEGLARLATEPYRTPDSQNLRIRNMHLTNYAVNKTSDNFDNNCAGNAGSKRLLTAVLEDLRSQGKDTDKLWLDIQMALAKTIVAVQPHLAHTYHTAARKVSKDLLGWDSSLCFELLGFDVLLDSDLNPWVLEVNHSPSFTCDSPIDLELKTAVIRQTILSLGLSPDDRAHHYAAEKAALAERLYAQSTRPSSDNRWQRLRPGSMAGKRDRLRAATAALEVDGHGGGPGRSHSSRSNQVVEESIQHYKTWGFSAPKARPQVDMGRFQRIFPHTDPACQAELAGIAQVAAKIYPPQGCMCNFCKRQCRTTLNMPSPLDIHLLDESQPVERGGRTRRGLAALPKETSSDASQPFGEEAGEDGAEGGSCASGEASSTSSFSNESQQEPAPEEAYIHRFSLATLGKNRSLRNAASKTPQNRATSLPHTPIDKGIGQRQQSYSDGSFERLSQHFQDYERRRSAVKDPVLGYGPKGSELKSTNLAKVAMQHSIQPSSHSMPFMADQREGSPTRESPGRSRRGPSRPYANLYAGYSSGPSKTTAKLNPTAARDGW